MDATTSMPQQPGQSPTDPSSHGRSRTGDHTTLLIAGFAAALLVAIVALWLAVDARNSVDEASTAGASQSEQLEAELQQATEDANEALTSLRESTTATGQQEQQLAKDVAQIKKDVQSLRNQINALGSRVTAVEQDVQRGATSIEDLDERITSIEQALIAPVPEPDGEDSGPGAEPVAVGG